MIYFTCILLKTFLSLFPMIGKTVSHYKILEKIGEGGMGIVYKAQDTKLDRIVALKFLPQYLASDLHEKERFFHEAKAASALNHTNITTIHEIDEYEGQVFIVMEYVEGQTLKPMLEKETLPIKRVLEIGIQVCEGLTAAHKKEIVHRDIKPDNIMVTKERQAKIMDFGLAKLKGATKLTKAGSTLGTASYMSPEQASGEEVDHRSDIFSFGVVLYEMLTSKLPFGGEHQSAIIYSILNEEPQPLARFNNQVSAKLQEIVEKVLAKDREERYQHIDDLLADLRREKKSLEYAKSGQIPSQVVPVKPKKKLLPILVPASIIALAAILFLILQPFKLEIGPQQKAIAQENSLAIMYFENVVDPEDQDKIAQMITSLLITDLSESQYMQVVSRQRLYDILKLLGKEDLKVIDKSVASEVAKKAEVKWILTGEVLQVKPNLVLTAELSEATSGKVLKAPRVTGKIGEDLFVVVDKLSAEIKKDLALPQQAKVETDKPVAEVTTHSVEAYRYYLEGVENLNKLYDKEARESFEKALQNDSTFAMAYFHLANASRGDSTLVATLVAKAVKYANRASHKEQMYIRALEAGAGQNRKFDQKKEVLKTLLERYPEEKEAWELLGGILFTVYPKQLRESVKCYQRVIEIDPNYKLAYNQLAYIYDDLGKFDSSIWAINKYIELAPNEPNPYDSRGDLYAYNGHLEQAIESYKKALEIKPDFMTSVQKLGDMYLFKGDYVRAESVYQSLAAGDDKGWRAGGRMRLAYVPIYQGKFKQGLKVIDDGLTADRMEKVDEWRWPLRDKYALKRNIYEEMGQLDSALKMNELVRNIVVKTNWRVHRGIFVRLFAKKKDFQLAETVAESIRVDIEKENKSQMFDYWWASSYIAKERGDLQKALELMEKAVQAMPDTGFAYRCFLGQAYLEQGRLDEAVALLEKGLNRYDNDRISYAIRAVKAYYYLAQAYEKSGWKPKAIENYQKFLEIWKNADPELQQKELKDAKERLSKLKIKA